MGSKSKSQTSNTTKNANIVNNNYGGGSAGTGSALADNINLVESSMTTGDITLTDHGAVNAGRDIATKALDTTAGTMENLIAGAYDDLGESRTWAGNLAGDALDGFQRTTEMALQRNSEAIKSSFAFARDSERSDAGLTIETVVPWAFGAVIVIALVLMWSNRK